MSQPAILFLIIVAPALAICLALFGLETLEDNYLGWFLLVFGISYLTGCVICYIIRREPFWRPISGERIDHEEKGDLSFWLILPGVLVILFAPPLEWMHLPSLLPHPLWMQLAGIVLILAGIALRVWARAHIHDLSSNAEIKVDFRLVNSGPYRIVHHPGYAGFLLLALGVAIGYSSWIGLVAIPLLLLPALAYRVHLEERFIAEEYGPTYQNYAPGSKKLIPGIW